MQIISKAPNNILDTRIFKALVSKSNPMNGLAEKATTFVEAATPLLDLIISGPFREFTLHNRDHAKKLIHLAEQFISNQTLQSLSGLEYLVLIYSSFLHDMGMSLTSTERERILELQEFQDTIQNWPELWEAINKARQEHKKLNNDVERQKIELRLHQLNEAAICAYLRPKHATEERYKALITQIKKATHRGDLFEVNGVSFEQPLIDICISHNLDVGVLAEITGPHNERFPRNLILGGEPLNVQFLAAVLRLIDILDFDRERTPPILFESLGIADRAVPGAEISLKEWAKHMAVHTISKSQEELVISADSTHPVVEKSIRDFCSIIEREIRDTTSVLRHNRPEILDKYALDIPSIVRPSLRSIGYTYSDMALRLNQSAILSRLMGSRLYSNQIVGTRELIQNAIDACEARHVLTDSAFYKPSITLCLTEEDGSYWLSVRDNGVGMDEHVLANYFLMLGNSYYASPEFQRLLHRMSLEGKRFAPIARFGIGLASVFLIADVIEIKTKRYKSPRGDHQCRVVRVERLGSLAYVRNDTQDEPGTMVRLKLHRDISTTINAFVDNLKRYLINTLIRPKIKIKIDLLSNPIILPDPTFPSIKEAAKDILESRGLKAFEFNLSRWSNNLAGSIIIILARTNDGKYSHLQDGQYIKIGPFGIEPRKVFENYAGNLVTVNGLRMHVKKMLGLLTGKANRSASRFAVVFDIDVIGNSEIDYDIPRNQVIGTGRTNLAREIWDALIIGLKETGVWDQLAAETRRVINGRISQLAGPSSDHHDKFKLLNDRKLLDAVKALIPKNEWPQFLHKDIAMMLGISNSRASAAISTLLEWEEISNPGKRD